MKDIKDRIKLIMENENLNAAQFADRLGINRAVISHILNGRNETSFNVIDKILRGMHISYDWLVYGEGEMYKQGAKREPAPQNTGLFSQNAVNETYRTENPEKTQEIAVKQVANVPNPVESKPIEPVKVVDRKVTQVIIYYSDNTFEVFG